MKKYIIIAEDGNGAIRCETVKALSRYRACNFIMEDVLGSDWTITHVYENTGEWDSRG